MAKIGLLNIANSDTFQIWLDRTNEIIDLLGTDVITASISGDVTGTLAGPKNATLIGNFDANTITASTLLKAGAIRAATGFSKITIENPTIVSSSSRVAFEAFSNNTDPVIRINNGTIAWDVGLDTDSQSFIINTGAAQDRFNLNTLGDLVISGNFTCDTLFVNTFSGDAIGDIYASDGINKVLENGTNGTDATFTGDVVGDIYSSDGVKVLESGTDGSDATFTGNVTGQVSDIGNHTAEILSISRTGSDAVLRIRNSAGTIVNEIHGASSNVAI
jgi:hypothetical protein